MLVRSVIAIGGVELDLDAPAVLGRFETFEVGDGGTRRNLVLIDQRQGRAITTQQRVAALFAVMFDQVVLQLVLPAADDAGNFALDRVGIVFVAGAFRCAGDQMQACQPRFADRQEEIDTIGLQCVANQVGDAFPDRGHEAVTGSVDQCRNIAAPAVIAQENANSLMFVQHDDSVRDAQQVFRLDLDQFVARVGFESVAQGLVVVAASDEAAGGTDGGDLAAHDRDVVGRDVVDMGSVEADEHVLANYLAAGVALENSNEIQIA